MSLRAQLWDTMRASPDDDLPRLVFADWLAEQGQTDRAAFVQAQVARAALPPDDPGRVSIELEEWALRHRSEASWRAELPQIDPNLRWGRYHRGFVRQVGLSDPQQWLDHASALMEATLIEGVVLPWARLGTVPVLPAHPQLRELTVYGTLIDDDNARWLADSPILSTVRRLNVVASDLGSGALRILLGSPHLQQLEALRLPYHQLDDDGVAAIIERDLRGLVELDLSANTTDELGSGGRYAPTIGPDGAEQLAAWPGLASVRRLVLTGQQLGVEGFEALLRSPHLAGLQHLGMRGASDWDWDTEGRADVLASLAHAHEDLALTSLDIGDCDLTAAGAQALAESPALLSLRTLSMDRISGASPRFDQLAGATFFQTLRRLEVIDISAGDSFWEQIFATGAPELHTLSMCGRYRWSRQSGLVAALSKGPVLPGLRRLDLHDGTRDVSWIEAVGTLETVPALEILEIGVDVDEQTAQAFLSTPLGARLTSVSVGSGETWAERLPDPGEPVVRVGNYRYTPWPL